MMKHILDWAYKPYLQCIKPFAKYWKRYVKNTFAVLGTVYSFVEIEQTVFKTDLLLNIFRHHTLLITFFILIATIILSREKTEVSEHFGKNDCFITLKLCDLLKQKGTAIVIPTNTTFDTTMYDEFISEKSVQGKFQKKFYRNKLEELDKLLQNSLDEKYHNNYEILDDRVNSKKRRYPIGSVAKITKNKTHYYFLAMSDVTAKGKPENVTMQTIYNALTGLWDYLDNGEHAEPIALPVIGTGRGRLQDGSLESVIQTTILSFISATENDFIAKNLTICIYPPSLKDSKVSWLDLCNQLKSICLFQSQIIKKDLAMSAKE